MPGPTRRALLAVLLLATCVPLAHDGAGAADPASAGDVSAPDPSPAASAGRFLERSVQTRDGVTLRYLLVRPPGWDPAAEYPVLIALPPGNQTRAMVEWGLRTYWADEARRRGWVVASPMRPTDVLLFNATDAHFEDLVAQIARETRIAGGKVHVAGVSNGGLSAFRAAVTHPARVRALVVLPGFPPNERDYERLAALRDVPVTLYVGARDAEWVPEMQRAERELAAAGVPVTLHVMPGEDHVIRSLTGGRALFDVLGSAS